MNKIFKSILLLSFILIGSNAQAGGCGGGWQKSISKFKSPKFSKYLEDKMVSFSEIGNNDTKEFSKISKCHKLIFGGKSKVKAAESLSLKKCQNMMKSDVAFQAVFTKQPVKNLVKSDFLIS